MNKNSKAPEAKATSKKPKNRKLTRGTISLLLTVLFIAAVVLVNIILSIVSGSFPLSVDVTENASYQLQSETKDYLSELKEPVDIYVLQKESDFESGDSTNYKYRVQANKLIRAIANGSDLITLHYVDLAAEPTFTTPYTDIDWTQSHAVLVTSGELYRAVDMTDLFSFDQEQYSQYGTIAITEQKVEQAMMTAIVNVTTKEKTKVTVLSGQGEHDMTAFTSLLENNAYEIETVSLLNDSISDDSEFVIIFDPDVDLDEKAYDTLTKWLKNDGKYGHHLFYFPNDQHELSDFPNLNALLADYGMELQYGYIYENSNNYLIPGANHYISLYDYGEDTTYTSGLRNTNIPVVMMLTMPITITDETTAKPLLRSSDKSFFFPKDLQEQDVKDFDPDPKVLNGAAIGIRNDGTDNSKNSSVVVIGSYDAMTANYLSSTAYNNAAYFVNLFNTLSERDDVSVVIKGKDPSSNELGITSKNAILFPSILVRFIIPIGVLLIGLIVWIRRRHQ